MTRAYLDHASTSPLRPSARGPWSQCLDASAAGRLGDPARLHVEGHRGTGHAGGGPRTASPAGSGVRPRQVVFTSGATESIAAATWGATGSAGSGTGAARTRGLQRGRALRGAGRGPTGDRAPRCPSTATAVSTPRAPRCGGHGPHGAGPPPVGQPRGRDPPVGGCERSPAAGPGLDRGPHAAARRCRPGGRRGTQAAAAGPTWCRSRATSWAAPHGIGVLVVRRNLRSAAAARRRRPGTRSTGGYGERRGRGGPGRGGRRARGRRPPASSTAAPRSPRRITGGANRTDGVSPCSATPIAAPPTSCASRSRASSRNRCCSDSTSVAWRSHSGSSCSSEAFEPSPVLRGDGRGRPAHRCASRSAGPRTRRGRAGRSRRPRRGPGGPPALGQART